MEPHDPDVHGYLTKEQWEPDALWTELLRRSADLGIRPTDWIQVRADKADSWDLCPRLPLRLVRDRGLSITSPDGLLQRIRVTDGERTEDFIFDRLDPSDANVMETYELYKINAALRFLNLNEYADIAFRYNEISTELLDALLDSFRGKTRAKEPAIVVETVKPEPVITPKEHLSTQTALTVDPQDCVGCCYGVSEGPHVPGCPELSAPLHIPPEEEPAPLPSKPVDVLGEWLQTQGLAVDNLLDAAEDLVDFQSEHPESAESAVERLATMGKCRADQLRAHAERLKLIRTLPEILRLYEAFRGLHRTEQTIPMLARMLLAQKERLDGESKATREAIWKFMVMVAAVCDPKERKAEKSLRSAMEDLRREPPGPAETEGRMLQWIKGFRACKRPLDLARMYAEHYDEVLHEERGRFRDGAVTVLMEQPQFSRHAREDGFRVREACEQMLESALSQYRESGATPSDKNGKSHASG